MFLNSWGCEVIAFTSTETKRQEALAMGAHHTIDSTRVDEIERHTNSFDLIMSTVDVKLDWAGYLSTLSRCNQYEQGLAMIKVVTTLRKRKDISTENFRAYYESRHRLIGEKYLSGYATRYVRRYMNPITETDGNLLQPEFDVLLEIWFPDESTFLACGKRLNEPDIVREIIDDEERLFDRSGKHSYIVEECESLMNC